MRATVVVGLTVMAALCSSCGTSPPAGSPALSGTITVFAASSLNAGYTAIGKAFQTLHPGTTVTFTFGGSSMLVSQIQQGAIGDVFASADQIADSVRGYHDFDRGVTRRFVRRRN